MFWVDEAPERGAGVTADGSPREDTGELAKQIVKNKKITLRAVPRVLKLTSKVPYLELIQKYCAKGRAPVTFNCQNSVGAEIPTSQI